MCCERNRKLRVSLWTVQWLSGMGLGGLGGLGGLEDV